MILWLVPLHCCPWYVRWWVLYVYCEIWYEKHVPCFRVVMGRGLFAKLTTCFSSSSSSRRRRKRKFRSCGTFGFYWRCLSWAKGGTWTWRCGTKTTRKAITDSLAAVGDIGGRNSTKGMHGLGFKLGSDIKLKITCGRNGLDDDWRRFANFLQLLFHQHDDNIPIHNCKYCYFWHLHDTSGSNSTLRYTLILRDHDTRRLPPASAELYYRMNPRIPGTA